MAPVVLAFGISIGLLPIVVVVLRRCGVFDVPNERSSHTQPTLRGGGLAPAIGVFAALLFAGAVDGPTRVSVLTAIGAFGLIGLAEDLFGVPILARLALQTVAVAMIAPWILQDLGASQSFRLLAAVMIFLFIVSYVNAFNFMDGINGISVAQTVAAGGVWYIVGRIEGVDSFAVSGAVMVAAALAFAPFNFPTALVFLGDVGSYAIGAALAVLALMGLRAGIAPEAVIAPLTVYLADTGATLMRRFIRGDPWYRPHRDHTYQQLVGLGWSHTTTTVMVGAAIALTGALGVVSLDSGLPLRATAGGGILVVLTAYLAAPELVRRRRPEGAIA